MDIVVSPARFERAAYSSGGCRSIQLSYEDTGRKLGLKQKICQAGARRESAAPENKILKSII